MGDPDDEVRGTGTGTRGTTKESTKGLHWSELDWVRSLERRLGTIAEPKRENRRPEATMERSRDPETQRQSFEDRPRNLSEFARKHAELLAPESDLPRGLAQDVELRHPDGSTFRVDRVDWDNGRFYVLRPETPLGLRRGRDLVDSYNEFIEGEPPSGTERINSGKRLVGELVTYGVDDFERVIHQIGEFVLEQLADVPQKWRNEIESNRQRGTARRLHGGGGTRGASTRKQRGPQQSVSRTQARGSEGDESEIEVQCVRPREVAMYFPGKGTQEFRSALGSFAEKLINSDFCKQTNCQPFDQHIFQGTDYFDNPKGGVRMIISFFNFHNDHLTDKELNKMRKSSMVKDKFRRPDIITHKPERKDLYEIKPNSRTGRSQGRKKLRLVRKFMRRFNLPYTLGTAYTPTREIEIGTVNVEGIKVDVFLRTEKPKRGRPKRGLLLYEYCIRGNLKEVSRRVGKKVRRLALLGFILSLIIPIEDPIDQPVPQPEPAPQPVPLPVPASEEDESADIPFIVPKPAPGPTPREFTFRYSRGLPEHAVEGEVYPIVISYESQGTTYNTVIEFQVTRITRNVRKLISTNTTPLNVAPTGHDPLIIKVANELTVTWHNY